MGIWRALRWIVGLWLLVWGVQQAGWTLPPRGSPAQRFINVHALPQEHPTTLQSVVIETGHGPVKIVPHRDVSITGIVRYVGDAPFMRDVVSGSCILTWGPANAEDLQRLVTWDRFSGGFKYSLEAQGARAAADVITQHRTRLYLVGATTNLARAIRRIRRQHAVRIHGALIDAESAKGSWKMEEPIRIRTDVCNMVWVTELQIEDRLYQ